MLQYEIDVPLYELAGMIGEENAAFCYKSGIDAINDLEKMISETKIDCGFNKKRSLYISYNKKAAKWLRQEFELRDKYNLGVHWLTADEVEAQYGVHSDGAIVSATAASVDAYKLAHELIQLNVKKECRHLTKLKFQHLILITVNPPYIQKMATQLTATKLFFALVLKQQKC